MNWTPIPFLLCCTLGGWGTLWGQCDSHTTWDPPIYNSLLRITTGGTTIKGRMLGMTDSSISIMRMKEKDELIIPARLISMIKVKRRFFRSVLLDFSVGTVISTFLVVSFYWHAGFDNPDYPSFGQVLWVAAVAGGGGGLLYGMAESAFFRLRIPVNKSLEVFRAQRHKLLKYWAD